MNTRIVSIVASALLLTVTTGCGGFRDFLCGRGARCGVASRLATAGQALNPLAPPPAPAARCGVAPAYQPQCAPMPPCAPVPPCGNGYAANPCGSGYAAGTSGYGGGVSGYGTVRDPYLNGYADGATIPYEGQVIEGVTSPDNFQARRFDSDGNVIIYEEPMPPGAVIQ